MVDTTPGLDLEDKARLNLTMTTRENIIKELTAKGMPEDSSDRKFLISALDGLDRVVLTRAKIKNDSQSSQAQQQVAGTIAQLLLKISDQQILAAKRVETPVLEAEFQLIDAVVGEMDSGVQHLTYETFMAK